MSYNLKILIWAINESKELMIQTCSQLLDTAKLFNIDYELIGIGIRFKEHKQRIWILRDYLRKVDKNDIVLCMDGADTLFNQSSELIFKKFKQASTRILFSAEKNYSHQYFYYKPIYDQLESNYKYLNAGTFIGYAGDLLEMLDEILEIIKKHPNANDQGLMGVWASRYLDQPHKVKLDIDCNIFWVTARDWNVLLDVSINNKYILNPTTHTKPSIIHVTGVGFAPHRQAYDAAFNLILNSPINKTRSPHLILLLAMPDVADETLWKKHYNKDELPNPAWYQNNHPYISLYFYNKSLSDHIQYFATSYSYEAILKLLNFRYFDHLVHVDNKLMLDIETLYETITQDFQFKTELGSEYPKSENFIYHNGLYFSFNPPLLESNLSYEENQDIAIKNHTRFLQKRIRELEESNRKIEHEVICLGKDMYLKEDFKKYSLFTHTNRLSIDFFSITNTYELVNGQFNEIIKSTPLKQGENEVKEHLYRIDTRVRNPQPILFIHCIIEKNLRNEILSLIHFMNQLKTKFNRNDRLVIIIPDQGVGMVKLQMLDYNIMVWATDTTVEQGHSTHHEIITRYQKIIEYALDEFNWKYDEQQLKYHPNLILNF